MAFAESAQHEDYFEHPLQPNPFIDVLHYDVSMDLRPIINPNRLGEMCADSNPATFKISVKMEVQALQDTSLVKLHYNPQTSQVISLTSGQEELEFKQKFFRAEGFDQRHGFIEVQLPNKLLAGEIQSLRFELLYDYHRQKLVPRGGYFHKAFACYWLESPDHLLKIFYLNPYAWGLRSVFPSHDILDDPATVEWSIVVDENYVVAANGVQTSGKYNEGLQLQDGSGVLYRWKMNQAISTSNMSFMVTEKEGGRKIIEMPELMSRDGRKLDFILMDVNSRDPKKTLAALEKIRPYFEYMEEHIGLYPFDKVGFVNWGAMEYASMAMGTYYTTKYHEFIHNWWGNSVRPAHFGDGWISEGITTYFEAFVPSQIRRSPEPFKKYFTDHDYRFFLNYPKTKLKLFYEGGAHCVFHLRINMAKFLPDGLFSELDYRMSELFMGRLYQAYKHKTLSSEQFVNFASAEYPKLIEELTGSAVDQEDFDAALLQWQKRFFFDFEKRE